MSNEIEDDYTDCECSSTDWGRVICVVVTVFCITAYEIVKLLHTR